MKKLVCLGILIMMAVCSLPPASAAGTVTLPLDSTVEGFITDAIEYTVYAITIAEEGKLSIFLTPEMSVSVAWVDSSGNAAAGTSEVATASYTYTNHIDVSAGTYYLRVSMFDRTFTGTYTLKATFAPPQPTVTPPPSPTYPPIIPSPPPSPTPTITPSPSASPTPSPSTPAPSATPSPAPTASPPLSTPNITPAQSPSPAAPQSPSPSPFPTPAPTAPPPLAYYTITTTAKTGGSASGGGEYASGASVTVKAVPHAGNTFIGWYENGVKINANPTYTFTATSNRQLEARFKLPQTGGPNLPLPLVTSFGALTLMAAYLLLRIKK